MEGEIYLETERTFLRNLNIEDSIHFFNLNMDEEVIKFTGDLPFSSISDSSNFLKNYDQYKKYGVGRLAVIDKATNDFLGWCGLKYSKDKNEYDIGFRFFRKYWNQGYATETSLEVIKHAFDKLEIDYIVGRAVKQNIGSIKVLKKIGLTYKQDFRFDQFDGVIYEISNWNIK